MKSVKVKTCWVVCVAVVMLGLANAPAAVVYNQWAGSSTDWNDAGNWAQGYVPFVDMETDQIRAGFKAGGAVSVWPVISDATVPVAEAWNVTLGGTNGGFLRIEGGTLNVGQFITMGASGTENGVFYINGGTINTGLESTNSHLFVGQSGEGTVYMNGGTVNLATGNLRIADRVDSKGTLYLDGGTINANSLLMPFAEAGSLSFGGGKLVLSGDEVSDVEALILAGKVVTSLAGHEVQAAYDGANTTVMAVIPEPATLCLLGVGLLGVMRKKR